MQNKNSATNQLLSKKTILMCSNNSFIELYKVFFKERFNCDLKANLTNRQFDIYELRLN